MNLLVGGMLKLKIPVDNGPYRDGKGSLYEGGPRVVALPTGRDTSNPLAPWTG